MKSFFLILIYPLLSCNGFSLSDETTESKAKELLIGRWALSTDSSFIVEIRSDSIIYYYKGHIEEKYLISFVFRDSLSCYYFPEDKSFDFMKNAELFSKIEILEYNSAVRNEVVNIVVYVDKNGLDLVARKRSVSFNRVNDK